MTRPPSSLTMLLSRHTRRREFITLLGGAAAAWPLAARAQQGERMRRIGVLMTWIAGRSGMPGPHRGVPAGAAAAGLDLSAATSRIEYRWAAGDADDFADTRRNWSRSRPMSSWPHGASTMATVAAGDPHRADGVRDASATRSAPASSIASRGRVATPPDFMRERIWYRCEMAGASERDRASVTRAAVLRDPAVPLAPPSSAPSKPRRRRSEWRLSPVSVRDAPEIERAIAAFARHRNGGLIVMAGARTSIHRDSDRYAGGPAPAACDLRRSAPMPRPAV